MRGIIELAWPKLEKECSSWGKPSLDARLGLVGRLDCSCNLPPVVWKLVAQGDFHMFIYPICLSFHMHSMHCIPFCLFPFIYIVYILYPPANHRYWVGFSAPYGCSLVLAPIGLCLSKIHSEPITSAVGHLKIRRPPYVWLFFCFCSSLVCLSALFFSCIFAIVYFPYINIFLVVYFCLFLFAHKAPVISLNGRCQLRRREVFALTQCTCLLWVLLVCVYLGNYQPWTFLSFVGLFSV